MTWECDAGSGTGVIVKILPWDLPVGGVGTINVTTDDLRLLANARAKSCLDYFLTTPTNKVEAGRVFLTEGALKTDGPRVEFVLQ